MEQNNISLQDVFIKRINQLKKNCITFITKIQIGVFKEKLSQPMVITILLAALTLIPVLLPLLIVLIPQNVLFIANFIIKISVIFGILSLIIFLTVKSLIKQLNAGSLWSFKSIFNGIVLLFALTGMCAFSDGLISTYQTLALLQKKNSLWLKAMLHVGKEDFDLIYYDLEEIIEESDKASERLCQKPYINIIGSVLGFCFR